MPFSVLAYSEYLIPGGENIGIELKTSGVVIVGTYQVNDLYPAMDAGLKVGDTITSINDQKVSTITEMVEKINQRAEEGTVKIGFMRENSAKNTNLKLYKDQNNVYKTGLYVKDTISGIGTLTFIDPNTKLFGALGHEITEKTTGKILEIKDGKIYSSNVTGISPSTNGTPGEKNAKLFPDEVKGTVNENTNRGLFGNYTGTLPDKKQYKVAQPSEIKKGTAKILTVVSGTEVKEFEINILKITDNQKTKNLLFEVTDPELLKISNGIVQGMSGSSIVQGDYIIGAVTHVVIDNPVRGYGIFITNMLEEAEN